MFIIIGKFQIIFRQKNIIYSFYLLKTQKKIEVTSILGSLNLYGGLSKSSWTVFIKLKPSKIARSD